MEPGHLRLDPLGPDRPLGRNPAQPGIEPRPGHPQESRHPRDRVVALLRVHQCERFSFVSDASWAKKSDAFFRNARSIFSSEFSLRSRRAARPARSPQATLAGLASRGPGPEVMDPPAQCLLLDAELTGHRGHRTTGVDHQLHGLVLVLRSELPTLSSHDEHPLLRGVHRTGSRPGGRLPSRRVGPLPPPRLLRVVVGGGGIGPPFPPGSVPTLGVLWGAPRGGCPPQGSGSARLGGGRLARARGYCTSR